jgi:hypothetical protein
MIKRTITPFSLEYTVIGNSERLTMPFLGFFRSSWNRAYAEAGKRRGRHKIPRKGRQSRQLLRLANGKTAIICWVSADSWGHYHRRAEQSKVVRGVKVEGEHLFTLLSLTDAMLL